MNLVDVTDQLSARLDTISGLRCFPYLADAVQPPAAVFPLDGSELTFDETYGRGMDRLSLPLAVVVGKVSDRASRGQISAYCNGSGASSVKEVLESGTYTAFDTVRVVSARLGVATIAATEYLAALFELDVAGSGS